MVADIRTRNPENSGRILIQPGVQVDFFANGRNLAGSEFAGTFRKNPSVLLSFMSYIGSTSQRTQLFFSATLPNVQKKKPHVSGSLNFVSEIILLTYFPNI